MIIEERAIARCDYLIEISQMVVVLLQSLDSSQFGEMSAIQHFLLIHLRSLHPIEEL